MSKTLLVLWFLLSLLDIILTEKIIQFGIGYEANRLAVIAFNAGIPLGLWKLATVFLASVILVVVEAKNVTYCNLVLWIAVLANFLVVLYSSTLIYGFFYA